MLFVSGGDLPEHNGGRGVLCVSGGVHLRRWGSVCVRVRRLPAEPWSLPTLHLPQRDVPRRNGRHVRQLPRYGRDSTIEFDSPGRLLTEREIFLVRTLRGLVTFLVRNLSGSVNSCGTLTWNRTNHECNAARDSHDCRLNRDSPEIQISCHTGTKPARFGQQSWEVSQSPLAAWPHTPHPTPLKHECNAGSLSSASGSLSVGDCVFNLQESPATLD